MIIATCCSVQQLRCKPPLANCRKKTSRELTSGWFFFFGENLVFPVKRNINANIHMETQKKIQKDNKW